MKERPPHPRRSRNSEPDLKKRHKNLRSQEAPRCTNRPLRRKEPGSKNRSRPGPDRSNRRPPTETRLSHRPSVRPNLKPSPRASHKPAPSPLLPNSREQNRPPSNLLNRKLRAGKLPRKRLGPRLPNASRVPEWKKSPQTGRPNGRVAAAPCWAGSPGVRLPRVRSVPRSLPLSKKSRPPSSPNSKAKPSRTPNHRADHLLREALNS